SLAENELSALNQRLEASAGDLLLLGADDVITADKVLGALRLELARRFSLIPQGRHDIRWVVEFPMFLWNDEEGRCEAEHHPFTAPTGDLDEPASLLSRSYDLVLDGNDLGVSSIRIHRIQVLAMIFRLLGISQDEA